MKKIVPFKKEITFQTNVSEITSISLEHNLHLSDNNLITGNFNISGEYKIADTSVSTEIFNFELPFDINVDEKYDLANLVVDIDDFYYENEDFDLDNIKEIAPIEIPNMNTNNENDTTSNVQENIDVNTAAPVEGNIDVVSTQPQVEVPNVFASTLEPVVENSIPNFAADETEMNKIVE